MPHPAHNVLSAVQSRDTCQGWEQTYRERVHLHEVSLMQSCALLAMQQTILVWMQQSNHGHSFMVARIMKPLLQE
jgi:hypothetical protein